MIKLFCMKKVLTCLMALMISLLILPVSVRADDANITISGASQVNSGEFLIVTVSASGNDVFKISGTINYPAKDLVIFEITPNDSLTNWTINYNSNVAGKISFNAVTNNKKSTINSSQVLFTVKFVVCSNSSRGLQIVGSGLTYSNYVTEQKITNQEQIDDALAKKYACEMDDECYDEIEIPEATYESVQVEKSSELSPSIYESTITRKLSGNCYLKEATFENAQMNPSFNKLTTNYVVQIDGIDDLIYNFVAENPNSEIAISKEANNQIVVSVTAENGEVASYIFNIKRTKASTDNNKEDKIVNNDIIITPGKLSTTTTLLLIALAITAIAIIVIGGYYVYQGSHVEVVDENE